MRAAASRPRPVLVRGGHRCAGDGLRAPVVRAAAPGDGAGAVAWSRRPITPLYGTLTTPRPHPLRILTSRRSSTNLEHSMRAVHLPKSHSPQGL